MTACCAAGSVVVVVVVVAGLTGDDLHVTTAVQGILVKVADQFVIYTFSIIPNLGSISLFLTNKLVVLHVPDRMSQLSVTMEMEETAKLLNNLFLRVARSLFIRRVEQELRYTLFFSSELYITLH